MGCPQLTPLCPQAFPTLVGDMDNSGSLNAQVLQLVAERIRTKAVFQVGPGGRGPRVLGCPPQGGDRTPVVPVPSQTHQAKFVTWQFDGEYRGDDCTATLTLGNPDILGESGEWGVPPVSPPGRKGAGAERRAVPTVILVAHFLQSVTPRLVLGGEMVYHRRPGEEGAILTLAGKYTGTRGGPGDRDTARGSPPMCRPRGTPRPPSPSARLLFQLSSGWRR